MSHPIRHGSAPFLLVSDLHDAGVQYCLQRFSASGLPLDVAPDVYAALARLVAGPPVQLVILDVRGLDDMEMAFIRLVDRCVPRVSLYVPALEGALQRLNRYGEDIRAVPLELILSHAQDFAQADLPKEESHLERPRVDTPRSNSPLATAAREEFPATARVSTGPMLSTDGGPEHAEGGPPLHEVVRRRMTEGHAPVVRRIPPQSPAARPESMTAGSPGAPQSGPGTGFAERPSVTRPNEALVSQEELNALLAPDPPAGDGQVGAGIVDPGREGPIAPNVFHSTDAPRPAGELVADSPLNRPHGEART